MIIFHSGPVFVSTPLDHTAEALEFKIDLARDELFPRNGKAFFSGHYDGLVQRHRQTLFFIGGDHLRRQDVREKLAEIGKNIIIEHAGLIIFADDLIDHPGLIKCCYRVYIVWGWLFCFKAQLLAYNVFEGLCFRFICKLLTLAETVFVVRTELDIDIIYAGNRASVTIYRFYCHVSPAFVEKPEYRFLLLRPIQSADAGEYRTDQRQTA